MVRFSSKASGDVSMLDAHAHRLLEILGKPESARGVITTEQLPEAIARLDAAIAQEASVREQADDDEQDEKDDKSDDDDVSLAQRAYPLLDMLRRAQARGVDVIWGL
jgi:hypothetical protein